MNQQKLHKLNFGPQHPSASLDFVKYVFKWGIIAVTVTVLAVLVSLCKYNVLNNIFTYVETYFFEVLTFVALTFISISLFVLYTVKLTHLLSIIELKFNHLAKFINVFMYGSAKIPVFYSLHKEHLAQQYVLLFAGYVATIITLISFNYSIALVIMFQTLSCLVSYTFLYHFIVNGGSFNINIGRFSSIFVRLFTGGFGLTLRNGKTPSLADAQKAVAFAANLPTTVHNGYKLVVPLAQNHLDRVALLPAELRISGRRLNVGPKGDRVYHAFGYELTKHVSRALQAKDWFGLAHVYVLYNPILHDIADNRNCLTAARKLMTNNVIVLRALAQDPSTPLGVSARLSGAGSSGDQISTAGHLFALLNRAPMDLSEGPRLVLPGLSVAQIEGNKTKMADAEATLPDIGDGTLVTRDVCLDALKRDVLPTKVEVFQGKQSDDEDLSEIIKGCKSTDSTFDSVRSRSYNELQQSNGTLQMNGIVKRKVYVFNSDKNTQLPLSEITRRINEQRQLATDLGGEKVRRELSEKTFAYRKMFKTTVKHVDPPQPVIGCDGKINKNA